MTERRTFLKTFAALLGLGLVPALPKPPSDGGDDVALCQSVYVAGVCIATPSYPNSTVGEFVYDGEMPIGYCVGKAANGDSIIQIQGMFETKGRAVSQAPTVR